MTIATTTATVTYAGTSSDSALATTFPFVDEDDLIVTQRVTATGVETTMVKGTDYTVTGGGAGGATGTVQIASGVGTTKFQTGVHTWTISRDTTLTQSTDYVSNDNFPAESHEDALDKLTLIAQDLGFSVDRSLKVPLSDDTSLSTEIPDSVSRASMYLGFNASGVPVALAAPTTTSITTPFSLNLLDDASDSEARATLGAQEDVITTQGDLIRGSSSNVAERLALGEQGSALVSTGSNIKWGLPRGYIDGFRLTNDAVDTAHDIEIAVGICSDDSASNLTRSGISLTSVITKQIDTAGGWVVGDDQAGRPVAVTLSNTTWYHVFVLRNPTTGAVDAGFDTSLTAVNLLAEATGYTEYRRVGSVLTDGSANIRQFTQFGEWFIFTTPTLDVDSSAVTTARSTFAIPAPLGIRTLVLANVLMIDAGGDDVGVQFTDQTDSVVNGTAAPLANLYLAGATGTAGLMPLLTNDLSQISARGDGAIDNLRVSVHAYMDVRGSA